MITILVVEDDKGLNETVYGLVFVGFLCFMMYLVYQCFCNVRAIHNDAEVANILFFDRIKIIK